MPNSSQQLIALSPQDAAAAQTVHAILCLLTPCFYTFITIHMGRLEDTTSGFQEELETDFYPSCAEDVEWHVAERPRIILKCFSSVQDCSVKTALWGELNVL